MLIIHLFVHLAISLNAHQTCPLFLRNLPLLEEGGHINRQCRLGNRLVRKVPASLGDVRASEKPQGMLERALNLEAENLGLSVGFITY